MKYRYVESNSVGSAHELGTLMIPDRTEDFVRTDHARHSFWSIVGNGPQSALDVIGGRQATLAANLANDFGLAVGFLQRSNAEGADHIQDRKRDLIQRRIPSGGGRVSHRALPAADDADDVGENGSQEETHRQERSHGGSNRS